MFRRFAFEVQNSCTNFGWKLWTIHIHLPAGYVNNDVRINPCTFFLSKSFCLSDSGTFVKFILQINNFYAGSPIDVLHESTHSLLSHSDVIWINPKHSISVQKLLQSLLQFYHRWESFCMYLKTLFVDHFSQFKVLDIVYTLYDFLQCFARNDTF